MNQPSEHPAFAPPPHHPVRRALFRGLAVVLPPLLTLVIFIWIGGTLDQYLLRPITDGARWTLVQVLADVRQTLPAGSQWVQSNVYRTPDGDHYLQLGDGRFVPRQVYNEVVARNGSEPVPQDGPGLYGRWIELRFLRPYVIVPLLLVVIGVLAYLLGASLAAGLGRMAWINLERLIQRVPLVSNLYAAVKQVTDYLFSDNELQFSRVVAVEYPRQGMWCISFVTGNSFLDLRRRAGEPVLAVFVPTSPVPFTGYALTFPKSQVVDLKMTIDEAFQYIISCGVVVPPEQVAQLGTGRAASDRLRVGPAESPGV